MERLLILDGNSLLNRAFYAIRALNTSEGVPTNAIVGFTNMLFRMQEDIRPDYIVTAFDRKAPTFRHLEYSDYKAGRKKMPPELAEQFPIIKEMLTLFAINIYELDGFEADDIIGTLAKYAENKDIEVYIVTGDKDALQLASDNVKVCITKKGVSDKEVYDGKRMLDEFGVTPTQFIDVKGLMGDASDNIPGVPGIGEKTAFKLIQTYGSIEETLRNIDEVKGKKIKDNLMQYREQAIFSKKLATIKTDVPVEFDLEDIRSNENYDRNAIKRLFVKLEMKSLLEKFTENESKGEIEEVKVDAIDIKDIQGLKELLSQLDKEIYISFKLNNLDKYSKIEISKIFINNLKKIYNIHLDEMELNKEVKEGLKLLFEDETIKKNCHSVKNAITVLRKLGIEFKGIEFDSEIGAYLINSSKGDYSLKALVNEYLGEYPKASEENSDLIFLRYMDELTIELKQRIKEAGMNKLMYDLELPLATVLSSMEAFGFNINREMLDELSKKFKVSINETSKEIYKLSDEEFNINSPKQLGKILFEKLDLPIIKKTKTGYSTNAEVLEKLQDKHPIIEKIIYYRQITKIFSTYVEGLKSVIDKDGYIHSNFNQTVTTTGRLSSTEPNLQNIPIKYEIGREIRKIFIPREKEDVLVSADYSQIELRVLAHISGDENMINAFKNHSDIHTKTASEVFKVPIEEVTSLMRSRAKAVNFGIVYGIGDFSLAQDLKITRKEAREYMDIYFDRYPKIQEYINKVIEEAKELGYVTTLLERRRFIPEINASNKIVKALGERLAMNAPIQGSAADIIKLSMVNVYNKLKERKLKSKLILQVHDELILNVIPEELEEIKDLVKNEMENVLDLSLPLDVDINVGSTWYSAK